MYTRVSALPSPTEKQSFGPGADPSLTMFHQLGTLNYFQILPAPSLYLSQGPLPLCVLSQIISLETEHLHCHWAATGGLLGTV